MNDEITISAAWDGPMDMICNGFSIKDTIKEVLYKYNNGYSMDLYDGTIDDIAEEIKEAFAVKLRMKQG